MLDSEHVELEVEDLPCSRRAKQNRIWEREGGQSEACRDKEDSSIHLETVEGLREVSRNDRCLRNAPNLHCVVLALKHITICVRCFAQSFVIMEHLAPTSFVCEVGVCDCMDQVEGFFVKMGARVQKRKPDSLSVWVDHPDGMEVCIKVEQHKFDKGYMEVVRRSGDTLLFHLVYKMLIAYDLGRGDDHEIYPGQLWPKVEMMPSEAPMNVPVLNVDVDLKRTRD
jgi:hypothetical protein